MYKRVYDARRIPGVHKHSWESGTIYKEVVEREGDGWEWGGGEEMIRPGLDDLWRLEAAGTARMDATLLASYLS